MDVNRLRFGEMIAAAAAAILFLVMFLDWYGAEGVSGGASAWESFTFIDLILFLTILLAVGLAVLTMTQRTVALPVSASVLLTALAGLATLLVLYRLINEPGFEVGVPDSVISIKFGAYLGLLATAAIAFGAFLSMRDEGAAFGPAASRIAAQTRPAPPPQPPGAPPPQAPGSAPVQTPGQPFGAPGQGAPPAPADPGATRVGAPAPQPPPAAPEPPPPGATQISPQPGPPPADPGATPPEGTRISPPPAPRPEEGAGPPPRAS